MIIVKYVNSQLFHCATERHQTLAIAREHARGWLDCPDVDVELAELADSCDCFAVIETITAD
jgi:hypothetical protein